ncbi:MAG: DUF2948 family protein [Caulobacteraceae bacterium]
MSPATTTDDRMHLLALDAEDLAVISAAVQDAVARVGDIRFSARERSLTLALNRYRWERVKGAQIDGRGERVRAALQFGGVLSVQARRIKREPQDAVVELLAVDFEPGEAPGGQVVLTFAGDGDLRLEVECIDAALSDVSGAWPARRAPHHDLAEG